MKYLQLNALKFSLAAGIYGALLGVMITIFGIFGIPGFADFAKHLELFYGPWGYSISWPGVLVGAFYGFQEGFVHVGLFGLIYNKLLKSSQAAITPHSDI